MDHPTYHIMTSNYTPDMLRCYPGFWNEELELWTSSVVQWSKDDDTEMDMSHELPTFDKGESPPRPHLDLKLHVRHAQLLPWILEPGA